MAVQELEKNINAIKKDIKKKEKATNMRKEQLKESTLKIVSNMKVTFDEKCYLEREILQSEFEKSAGTEKINHILKKVEKQREIT